MKRNKNVTGLMLDSRLEFTAIIIFVNILMSYGVDSTEPTGETVSPPHSLQLKPVCTERRVLIQ